MFTHDISALLVSWVQLHILSVPCGKAVPLVGLLRVSGSVQLCSEPSRLGP